MLVRYSIPVLALSLFLGTPAQAQNAPKAKSVGELLKRVKDGYRQESAEYKKREAEFKKNKDRQAALLQQARDQLKAAEKRSENFEAEYQANERSLTELEATRKEKSKTMDELFAVLRGDVGEVQANIEGSMISAQFPGRQEKLVEIANGESAPTLKQLEHFWYVMTQEMTESGKVVRFKLPVVSKTGEEKDTDVIRVGTFNLVSGGKFYKYNTENGKIQELGRQPGERFLNSISRLEKSTSGFARFALDPSKGAILSVLIQQPTTEEWVKQGGTIGFVVIGLGLLAAFIGLLRILYLGAIWLGVQGQLKSSTPKKSNPLGRVMGVYDANPDADPEELEIHLDEAIVRETARMERIHWFIKVIAVAAPLLGLLGTVVGMIKTFQAITLFGTGDPTTMASGISEALVTTRLGLTVAVPLVIIHATVSSMAQRLVDILEEQAAGFVARRSEKKGEG